MKLLFLDTETGGLDEDKNSLLSVGMAVWNNYKIENVFEIYVKEPVLRITPEAMMVNRIDLRKFNQIAVSVEEAQNKIEQYLYQNFGLCKKCSITLAGMNPNFDINFMKACFGKPNINKWFSHRSVDLQGIITYLYIKGLISTNYSSSESVYKYFNINNGIVEHEALKDCLNEIKLFEKLLKLEKKCKR